MKKLLPVLRRIHLYLGVFTAPAILFFSFTGALQTFSLHEASHDGSYKPERWIMVLAQIHKKQTSRLPSPKSGPAPAHPKDQSAPTPEQPKPNGPKHETRDTLPLKCFFVLVAVGLCISTLSGLSMAWRIQRNKVLLGLLFFAGSAIPVLLLSV